MLSSDFTDDIVFKRSQKQTASRLQYHEKHAGQLDLDRTAGKSNVLTTDKQYKQTTTPEWMKHKAKRNHQMKKKRAKQKAILRQQKAYRKAKEQKRFTKTSTGELDVKIGEEVDKLKWLDFHKVAANSDGLIVNHDMKHAATETGAENHGSNQLLAELTKMTKDEFVANEFARKAGKHHGDSTKAWDASVDQGTSAVDINDEFLTKDCAMFRTEEGTDAHEALPELFHGFQHNLHDNQVKKQENLVNTTGPTTGPKRKENDSDNSNEETRRQHHYQNDLVPQIALLRPLEHKEPLDQSVLPDLNRTGTPSPKTTDPLFLNHSYLREKECPNPSREFLDNEEAIANHHVDPNHLQTLSYEIQKKTRKDAALIHRISQPFDLTLPVKNMRILKPKDFSIQYLSHCMVRDGRSPFFYHKEYRPPKVCCLGNGVPRHLYDTVPMLCKIDDPSTHSNPTWGTWKVPRTIVIRDFRSKQEAEKFASVNRITNIFPGASIPTLHKKSNMDRSKDLKNNALMKGMKKKKLSKKEKKAKKLKEKKELAEEEERKKQKQLEEDLARTALLDSNKIIPREVSTTINDYGVVKARTWYKDEGVLVLENGKVLGICNSNPCWVPASDFEPIEELQGHYILQANWGRGKWRALDRNGRTLVFKVPRRPVEEGKVEVVVEERQEEAVEKTEEQG